MAIFAIWIEEDIISLKYMEDTKQRLGRESLVHNPFIGSIKRWNNKRLEGTYYGIDITPIYPKIYLWGIVLALVPLLFTGLKLTIWNYPGMVLFCGGVFWHRLFFYAVLRMGLRKAGYKGKIKLLSNSDILKRIISNEV